MMTRARKPVRESGRSAMVQQSKLASRLTASKAEERWAPAGESRVSFSLADIDIFPRETVQPKMKLGPVGDRYEQEADQIARRVVETISSPDQYQVQRKADASLRRKIATFSPARDSAVSPEVESAIQRARSGGMPIPDSVRQPMERAFGADFGGVRVHANGQADSLNRSIKARAFTTGRDIFLRQGEYRPASSEGQRLLAHELTHVVQQSSRIVGNVRQFKNKRITQGNSVVSQVIQLTRAGDDANANILDPKDHDNVFDRFMTFLHDNNFIYTENGINSAILEGASPANCGRLAGALNDLFAEVGLTREGPIYSHTIYVDIDNDFAEQLHPGRCIDAFGNPVRAFYFNVHSYLNGYDPTLGKRGAAINFENRINTSSANDFIQNQAASNGHAIRNEPHDLVNAHQFPGFYILTRGIEKSVKVMNDQILDYLLRKRLIRPINACTIL